MAKISLHLGKSYKAKRGLTQRAATVLEVKAVVAFYGV
jgi:hypothetical protein